MARLLLNYSRRVWQLMPLSLLLMLLSGCPRQLPDQVHGDAQVLQATQKNIQSDLTASENALRQMQNGPDAAFLAPYAKREAWAESLKQARASLNQAQPLSQKVQQLIARNEASEESDARTLLDNLRATLTQARQKAALPKQRIDSLKSLRVDGARLVEEADRKHRNTQTVVAQATSKLRAASPIYVSKKNDLNTQATTFVQLEKESSEYLTTAQAQLDNLNRGRFVDDKALREGCQQVGSLNEKATTQWKEWSQKLSELSRSSTLTLVDMKVDYYVQINRESWNESSESESTYEYVYPPKLVDKATYQHFSGFMEDQVLATQGSGWLSNSSFALNSGVDAAAWSRLGIDPQENLSDGTAEWALDGLDEKYFHKYLSLKDGVVEQMDWQQVTPAFFEAHEDDLGMDISSKPVGAYESETSHFASPVGMSYVGNPQYGRWRSDGGNRFWEFTGQYLLLNSLLGPSRRYPYSQWSGWNGRYRGRAPYYGPKQKEEDEDQYGTHSRSVGGSSYFARSYWVSSGEHQSQVASVRGAGRAARGGGPGGGGK